MKSPTHKDREPMDCGSCRTFRPLLARRILRPLLLIVIGMATASMMVAAQEVSIPEEIEWTWEVRPPHPDPKLPNVLLLGDSITRNYFPEVTKDLAGVANVYLMASSTCVGDPRLPQQIAEFLALEHVHFRVVHFNNGMHGFAYTEAQYREGFPGFLAAVHKAAAPGGALIWATTTPVLPNAGGGATNPRIDARNAIADAMMKGKGITIDDQHALMLQHQDLHQDPVHFNPAGSALEGDQAAHFIRDALDRAHPR